MQGQWDGGWAPRPQAAAAGGQRGFATRGLAVVNRGPSASPAGYAPASEA